MKNKSHHICFSFIISSLLLSFSLSTSQANDTILSQKSIETLLSKTLNEKIESHDLLISNLVGGATLLTLTMTLIKCMTMPASERTFFSLKQFKIAGLPLALGITYIHHRLKIMFSLGQRSINGILAQLEKKNPPLLTNTDTVEVMVVIRWFSSFSAQFEALTHAMSNEDKEARFGGPFIEKLNTAKAYHKQSRFSHLLALRFRTMPDKLVTFARAALDVARELETTNLNAVEPFPQAVNQKVFP